jgi:hypothetical protein
VLRRIERNAWRQFRSRESLQEDHPGAAARAMPKGIFAGRWRQFARSAEKMGQQLAAKGYTRSAEANALSIDVANLQSGHFRASHTCAVQGHQQGALLEIACCIDGCTTSCQTQHRRQATFLFGIGQIFPKLVPLQRAHKEKSQSGHASDHGANRQFALFEQIGLIAAKLAWS